MECLESNIDLKLCKYLANFKKTLKSRMLNEFLKQK